MQAAQWQLPGALESALERRQRYSCRIQCDEPAHHTRDCQGTWEACATVHILVRAGKNLEGMTFSKVCKNSLRRRNCKN